MDSNAQIIIAFVFGLSFVITLITLAIRFPEPTPFQYSVFRTVFALAAAGVGAVIPGFLDVSLNPSAAFLVRAGGGLAVFVIVYFWNPAHLVTSAAQQSKEQSWPIVQTREALLAKLQRVSHENKRILRLIAESDQYIYVMQLAEQTGIARSELIYRGKELEAQHLIEVIQLTDTAYKLHPEVLVAVDSDPAGLIQFLQVGKPAEPNAAADGGGM